MPTINRPRPYRQTDDKPARARVLVCPFRPECLLNVTKYAGLRMFIPLVDNVRFAHSVPVWVALSGMPGLRQSVRV